MSAYPLPPRCNVCGVSRLRTELGWSGATRAWYCEPCFADLPAAEEPEPERVADADASSNGAGPTPATAAASAPAEDVSVVTLQEFISVDEPGAESLVGTADDNLIPEGGDVMFYGDGGTAKTTLTVDLAFHLAAGKNWLGYPIALPVRVLIVENEGPRPASQWGSPSAAGLVAYP